MQTRTIPLQQDKSLLCNNIGRRPPTGRRRELGTFPLLAELSREELAELSRASQARAMNKGQFVYLPGDEPDALYFVASGRVKTARLSDHGKEFILDIIEPGDFFGETGVLDQMPRESMAESLEPSVVWTIPAGSFRRLLGRKPALLMTLTRLLGQRQKKLEKRLMDVVHKNAPQRLADLLLQLAERYGVADTRGTLLRIKLSQSALGNLLGVSREIVNHTFSGLRREGVIDVAEGRVIIQNRRALVDLAA